MPFGITWDLTSCTNRRGNKEQSVQEGEETKGIAWGRRERECVCRCLWEKRETERKRVCVCVCVRRIGSKRDNMLHESALWFVSINAVVWAVGKYLKILAFKVLNNYIFKIFSWDMLSSGWALQFFSFFPQTLLLYDMQLFRLFSFFEQLSQHHYFFIPLFQLVFQLGYKMLLVILVAQPLWNRSRRRGGGRAGGSFRHSEGCNK